MGIRIYWDRGSVPAAGRILRMSGDAGGPEAGAGLPPPPPDAMLDAQGAATALWLQQSAPAGTDALPPSVSVDGTVSASWLQAMHLAHS